VPILSIFEDALNDAEERIKARMEPLRKDLKPTSASSERYTLSYTNPGDVMENDDSFGQQAKKERTKQALLAMLPSYERLNKILTTNSEWWQTWRRKCSGTSASDETLPQFASKALASGNIGAIGTVVLAVGICSDDEKEVEKFIEIVDRWVLGDDEFAATLEGMECLILKAKWYADVGQPRRAWLAYRKGLMYIQLMVCLSLGYTWTKLTVLRAFTANALHQQPMNQSGGPSIMATASSRCSWVFLMAFQMRTAT
jgi:hypothetical protein